MEKKAVPGKSNRIKVNVQVLEASVCTSPQSILEASVCTSPQSILEASACTSPQSILEAKCAAE